MRTLKHLVRAALAVGVGLGPAALAGGIPDYAPAALDPPIAGGVATPAGRYPEVVTYPPIEPAGQQSAAPSARSAPEGQHPSAIDPAAIEALHTRFLSRLTQTARRAFQARFPNARIVDLCEGAFSAPDAREFGVAALDHGEGGDGPQKKRLLRLLLLADGSIASMQWADAEKWAVNNGPVADEDSNGAKLWIGALACVPPSKVDQFVTGFVDDFVKKKSVFTHDAHALTSYCFSFDPTYNCEQCYAFDRSRKRTVRWGYQVVAD